MWNQDAQVTKSYVWVLGRNPDLKFWENVDFSWFQYFGSDTDSNQWGIWFWVKFCLWKLIDGDKSYGPLIFSAELSLFISDQCVCSWKASNVWKKTLKRQLLPKAVFVLTFKSTSKSFIFALICIPNGIRIQICQTDPKYKG